MIEKEFRNGDRSGKPIAFMVFIVSFLGDELTFSMLVGTVLVAAGIYLVNVRN